MVNSGVISISDIASEFGGGQPYLISNFYRGGGLVPNIAANSNVPISGIISIADFYGTTSSTGGKVVVINSYTMVYSDIQDVCSITNSVTVWQNSSSFDYNTNIYSDENATSFATQGYYKRYDASLGKDVYKYWTGTYWSGSVLICSSGNEIP